MKDNLCILCKTNMIQIKKRGLCKKCYSREYNLENVNIYRTSYNNKNIKHLSEIEFIKNFFKNDRWIYQPVVFRIEKDIYNPDFYDIDRNVFIEVSSCNQAYKANEHKYNLIKKLYPKINFEIRSINGEIFNINKNVKN
jgi:hypothetical protein